MASFNVVEEEREFFARLLEHADIVFANEEEAHAFTGMDAEAALEYLSHICRVAVVKLGAKGAAASSNGETVRVSAGDAVTVVDTTAAGDYFAAGFLYAHSRGFSLSACLQCGTVLANEIIQVVGTRLEEPVWADIRRRVQRLD